MAASRVRLSVIQLVMILIMVLIAATMCPWFVAPCRAQRLATATPSPTPSPTRSMQRITVNADRAPLMTVLNTIARQAGLVPVFNEAIIPTGMLVTLHAREVTAADAFQQVLRGTRLIARVHENGDVVIVPSTGPIVIAGTIVGTVVDAKTKQPIVGAMVFLDDARSGGTSGNDGSFRIAAVAPGPHIIRIRRIGYTKWAKTVTVIDGQTTSVDVTLESSVSTLDQVIVTGTVAETELRAVPSAMTVITAKQIEERGITRIDQLFRGDVPGLFAVNTGSGTRDGLGGVIMFSRGASSLSTTSAGTDTEMGALTNPIKTYVDGVELADAKYLSQIDPSTIERIEILTGPQASTIYGSNAMNGVMQIFTKRGHTTRPQLNVDVMSGVTQNNYSAALAPNHTADARVAGVEGRWSYTIGGSADFLGSWTPARHTTRYNASGGGRMNGGQLTTDVSLRQGITQNQKGGDREEGLTALKEEGLVRPNSQDGISDPKQSNTLNGQTVGITLGYAPTGWWSHELVVGYDDANVEVNGTVPSYAFAPSDTLVTVTQSTSTRTSQRYSTTARLSVAPATLMTVTFGADHWRTRSTYMYGRGLSTTGILGSTSVARYHPDKNTGGFLQGQVAINDALFLTYGLRAEWNPNYGADAQPNRAPRYGVAYTRDIGVTTLKLRASYGRATRPPTQDLKLDGLLATSANNFLDDYGPIYQQRANPDLGPEYQQGGEGGIELYLGHVGSLVVTRYNQTVDALIGSVSKVDSARSRVQNPLVADYRDADGYGYKYISQYLNVGSIRNQGWELQGSVNAGPFSTHGTYSWTKSRVLGVTPAYRGLFTGYAGQAYQVGRSFDFLPEHTWAITVAYVANATNINLTVNGSGQRYVSATALSDLMSPYFGWRYSNLQPRIGTPDGYRALGSGYSMTDLNISHRISSAVEGVVQVHNLTDFYQNDVGDTFATPGRQTQAGVRIRW